MATQHVVVFCSTGLASSERRSLEQAIGQLGRCQYHGDLTDRTTHLVAHDGAAPSEKVMCAKKLRLPIVRPKWIVDSAANGGTVLLPLDAKYLSRVPMDENEPPQQSEGAPQQPRQLQALPQPAVGGFVPDPLALLRVAAERGELSLEPTPLPASTTTVSLCGQSYALDVPTGFKRHHTLMPVATSADDGSDARDSSAPRAYTLRELLFAVRCSSLSHSDYFLQCVLHACEPVLLLDKRALHQACVTLMSDGGHGHASPPTASGGDEDASRLLEGPLSMATLAAIDLRATPLKLRPPSAAAEADAASVATVTPSQLAAERRLDASSSAEDTTSSMRRQLQDAAEDRARLNAQVASLSARLQEERSRTEAAAVDVISAAASAGVQAQ